MNEEEILQQEFKNTGTSWTNNKQFDKNGYLVIENLCDPEDLYYPVPKERGQIKWWRKNINQYEYFEEEHQVSGSLSRYLHPMYKEMHSLIRLKIEKIIGRKLYNTYYYDRFYFSGQELKKHVDRDACEISATVHVSSNLKSYWPIYIKTPDRYTDSSKTDILVPGENRFANLNPGDGMIYKGCERPHWRYPMSTEFNDSYYHQIFFHYVLQDGIRAHCAWDMSR